ncbi:hypothetical protein [Iningainema tapete]|uniref:Uncharacterized protein n=1 Tax=Iningainema tapete BLCC-T55 TaxID=2748662 RepID=A0A8J7C633_9CYAN|nr:hypothetical protein [Iningainema tapete]MBD2771511.1 hypothetical protein [Iningainema tapete BLCC-T55]
MTLQGKRYLPPMFCAAMPVPSITNGVAVGLGEGVGFGLEVVLVWAVEELASALSKAKSPTTVPPLTIADSSIVSSLNKEIFSLTFIVSHFAVTVIFVWDASVGIVAMDATLNIPNTNRLIK